MSSILHVLLHMAERDGPVTSEALAAHMGGNAVQVRRTMAGLRKAGLLRSEKGHGGGWAIACDLGAVTMRDIYVALGSPGLFAMGNRRDDPACLVEQAVNAALGETFAAAEQLVLDRFADVTLADLAADFHHRAALRRGVDTKGT